MASSSSVHKSRERAAHTTIPTCSLPLNKVICSCQWLVQACDNMTGLRTSAAVLLLVACVLLLASYGVADDTSNRKLLAQRSLQQNRPWEQWMNQGNRGREQGQGNRGREQGQGQGSGQQNRPWEQWMNQGNRGQGQGQGQDNKGQGQGQDSKGQGQDNKGQGQGQGQDNKGQGQNNKGQGQGNMGGAGSSAGGQAQGNPNRNKGDTSSLSRLGPVGGALNYRNRPRQTIAAPTTGLASQAYKGLRTRGDSRAAAKSLAEAFNSDAQAAAAALSSAATEGGDSMAVAQAVAQTTVAAPNVASSLLAKSASLAVNNGQTQPFASTMADTFSVAKQQNTVPQLTSAVSDAVAQGGEPATLAFGEAIATAVAQGGDSKAAVAEATATAICTGGSTAEAWSSAFAVALSKDSNGCLVLNEAKAMAQAKCGQGAAQTITKAQATSVVLGFCGLLDFFPNFDFSFGTTQSGSTANAGR